MLENLSRTTVSGLKAHANNIRNEKNTNSRTSKLSRTDYNTKESNQSMIDKIIKAGESRYGNQKLLVFR